MVGEPRGELFVEPDSLFIAANPAKRSSLQAFLGGIIAVARQHCVEFDHRIGETVLVIQYRCQIGACSTEAGG